MMKRKKNEFLALLCNLYIVALLAALPLYTGDGYGRLGDIKYMLFRNISVLCLGIWLGAGMPGRIRAMTEWGRGVGAGAGRRGTEGRALPFNWLDWAVAAYAVCVVISAVCSSYGKLAWTGYDEWYMGAYSQLLFVGIYFFVSRQYDGASWPLYLGEAALFVVTLLGLLHRLGIDPLGLMTGWTGEDWEYSHLLSTLGNINWLCGYYSAALAFLLVHFLRERRRWLQILLYLVSMLSFVLLGIQGSQSGWLILAACTGACILLGRGQKGISRKICLLLSGFFLCMPLMELLVKIRGERAAMPADGDVFAHTAWYTWLIAGCVSLLLFLLAGRTEGKTAGKGRDKERKTAERDEAHERVSAVKSGYEGRRTAEKGEADGKVSAVKGGYEDRKTAIKEEAAERGLRGSRMKKIMIFGGIIAALLIAFLIVCRSVDDGFGSGRGFLWRISLEWFSDAGLKDKLIGAGPDCYGAAVFQSLGMGSDVWKGERWEYSIFTNAHNEFLSQLCNTGILGAASYGAIFLAGLGMCLGRCRGERGGAEERSGVKEKSGAKKRGALWQSWLGFLAFAMYGIHSLVSFQQVLNAPLLFLALGVCGSGFRDGN